MNASNDKLRRLCSAATPGKRVTYCKGVGQDIPAGYSLLHSSARGQGVAVEFGRGVMPAADDKYHAALSPDVVLGLLDEIEQLRQRAENAEQCLQIHLESNMESHG